MRIGIICEGSTDHVVLRAVVQSLCAHREIVFTALQPPADGLGRIGLGGWQAVRSFLRRWGSTLGVATLDMIVVQVDADIRHHSEIIRHLDREDGDAELDPLCRHVKSWMAERVPESVVIVLPRERTESWLLAATGHRKHVESILDPDEQLPDSGSSGGHEKSAARYEGFTNPLIAMLRNPKQLRAVRSSIAL